MCGHQQVKCNECLWTAVSAQHTIAQYESLRTASPFNQKELSIQLFSFCRWQIKAISWLTASAKHISAHNQVALSNNVVMSLYDIIDKSISGTVWVHTALYELVVHGLIIYCITYNSKWYVLRAHIALYVCYTLTAHGLLLWGPSELLHHWPVLQPPPPSGPSLQEWALPVCWDSQRQTKR